MLEVTGENKDKVVNTVRQSSPAETVDVDWVITREIGELHDAWRRENSWDMMDAAWAVSDLVGKLGCVRDWVLDRSSRLEQEEIIQKRLSVAV